ENEVKVNYLPTGSGSGIRQLVAQALDFACSEAPLTAEQLRQAKEAGGDVIYVPVALGGIVPVYNLKGLSRPLRFSGVALAGIYLGDIKRGNDPALVEINAGADLPDRGVVVIRRSDPSGSTHVLTDFLSKASKEWNGQVGTTALMRGPVGIGARGSEGVVEAVEKRPGAIAYVDLLDALKAKLTFGSVKNRA